MKKLLKFLLLFITLTATSISVTSCDLEDGKDGADGVDGVDGADGQDGEDGADGSDVSVYLAASKSPSLLKVTSSFVNLKITPILSSEDVIPNTPNFVYGSMADGAGLINNGNETFTLINNIEADYSIARIMLNKNLRPYHGEYILNAAATAETAQCSGSLISPEEHGFGPLYLSGGEWGGASKGVFLTDPAKDAADASTGKLLNAFGQWSTENAVVIGKDAYADKTVAFIGDDHSDNSVPSGQLGMYVGDRGDLEGGKLYGLKVTTSGIDFEVDMVEGTEYDAEFVELTEREIAALDAEAKAKGVMGFSRLEDIDWRRGSASNQKEVYFAVTGRDKPDLVGKGTILGRIYKVVLNDTDPTGTCKITCVLDGDKVGGKAEGFHSPDNILVTENYAYIQEDPNGYLDTAVNGFAKLYQYNLSTGTIKTVLECDQNRAAGLGYGTISRNWEITGMIDVTDVVNNGDNTFLLITQNHGWEPADGTSFTDPKANPDLANRKEGSMLYIIKGLDR
ncbi:alkaline phosphatase PhoX [Flavivirga abyssicola]|uniref:alkaline phosphatase PhoX n=1 Tax=Flavivirga abyssicola TaxID=3063533 RepID=UPI0026DF81F3|nr:alkaline phosphatase PhoX [Flavivirga sp. MEBiC07777]WVK13352.1 alkaline phosphatase PhoX [Flavivirga sp. MEBiC07777]